MVLELAFCPEEVVCPHEKAGTGEVFVGRAGNPYEEGVVGGGTIGAKRDTLDDARGGDAKPRLVVPVGADDALASVEVLGVPPLL